MNVTMAKKCLKAYLAAGMSVMISGKNGIGKSEGVYQVADELGAVLVEERATTLESVDVRGLPFRADAGVDWAKPKWLTELESYGDRPTMLFIDELVQGSVSVQTAFFQLVWNRAVGLHKLPPRTMIVAAGNRQIDRSGVNKMPVGLANRFAWIDVEEDMDAWQSWANKALIEPLICAFLRYRPALLHNVPQNIEVRAFPSPRSWVQVAKVIHADDDIRQKLIEGLVGEGAASELEAFIQTYKTLPPLAEIIAHPRKAAVPSAPNTQFAVVGALARKADRGNFEAILIYGGRLTKDFEMTLVTDAVKRDPSLKTTKAYTEWATRNQDISI
jgi:MoxR-like ATPase